MSIPVHKKYFTIRDPDAEDKMSPVPEDDKVLDEEDDEKERTWEGS